MYRDKAQRDFARTLRNGPTPAEKRLWHFLRAQKLSGHKFRRQAAIGSYIVDFVCFQAKLIVELDGPQHLEPAAIEYDKGRTNASRSLLSCFFRRLAKNRWLKASRVMLESMLRCLKSENGYRLSASINRDARTPARARRRHRSATKARQENTVPPLRPYSIDIAPPPCSNQRLANDLRPPREAKSTE